VPRSITISVPQERAPDLVDDLSAFPGTLTLSRQPQASVVPPGDVVTVEVLDASISEVFALLSRYGVGTDKAISVTSSEPTAVVSASSSQELARDRASSSFEEVEATLERESTMGPNKVAAMLAAGVIATVGLETNSVHLVIGAMVVAPGFEPFLKVALRVAGRGRSFRQGFMDIGLGWTAVVVGAAGAALLLRLVGVAPDSTSGGYLGPGRLLDYWREWTASATIVAIAGGVAGTMLVVATRAVLTAGVMIALALVPGAALVGIAAVHTDMDLAVDGAMRWAHDAVILTVAGAVTFAIYRLVRGRGIAGDRR
jgi:hypothetical protein